VLGDPAEASETNIQNVVDTYVDHIENERRSVYIFVTTEVERLIWGFTYRYRQRIVQYA